MRASSTGRSTAQGRPRARARTTSPSSPSPRHRPALQECHAIASVIPPACAPRRDAVPRAPDAPPPPHGRGASYRSSRARARRTTSSSAPWACPAPRTTPLRSSRSRAAAASTSRTRRRAPPLPPRPTPLPQDKNSIDPTACLISDLEIRHSVRMEAAVSRLTLHPPPPSPTVPPTTRPTVLSPPLHPPPPPSPSRQRCPDLHSIDSPEGCRCSRSARTPTHATGGAPPARRGRGCGLPARPRC